MILAVYGTLRRGGPANGLLRGSKWLGMDRIPGCLFAVGTFPGARFNAEHVSHGIVVDLYQLPEGKEDDYFERIDRYEGFYPEQPDQCLFLRKEVTTVEGQMPVIAYEYRFTPVAPLILSGDWFDASTSKS